MRYCTAKCACISTMDARRTQKNSISLCFPHANWTQCPSCLYAFPEFGRVEWGGSRFCLYHSNVLIAIQAKRDDPSSKSHKFLMVTGASSKYHMTTCQSHLPMTFCEISSVQPAFVHEFHSCLRWASGSSCVLLQTFRAANTSCEVGLHPRISRFSHKVTPACEELFNRMAYLHRSVKLRKSTTKIKLSGKQWTLRSYLTWLIVSHWNNSINQLSYVTRLQVKVLVQSWVALFLQVSVMEYFVKFWDPSSHHKASEQQPKITKRNQWHTNIAP